MKQVRFSTLRRNGHRLLRRIHASAFLPRMRRGREQDCPTSLLLESQGAGQAQQLPANPLTPKPAHFAPRAKNVIYLFMAGR